jgi:hypothetical protein
VDKMTRCVQVYGVVDKWVRDMNEKNFQTSFNHNLWVMSDVEQNLLRQPFTSRVSQNDLSIKVATRPGCRPTQGETWRLTLDAGLDFVICDRR